MEIFLAKLIGLYFIIVGVVVLLRRKSLMPAISDLARNRGAVLLIAFVELVAGLALIIAYPEVTPNLTGLLSLIGWILLIEAIVYLTLPTRYVRKMVAKFNTPRWYVAGGLVSIVIGGYLAGIGFGF